MRHPSLRPMIATAVALMAAASLALADAPGAVAAPRQAVITSTQTCTSTTAPVAAKLRVQVTSTAPWVEVHLPGSVTGRLDRSTSGGAIGSYLMDGLRVSVPAGSRGTFETDLITVDPSLSTQVSVGVDRASSGSVNVKVWSPDGYGTPVSLSPKAGTTDVTVARSSLFNPSFALPKADSRKLVLAAYYPWFGVDHTNVPAVESPLDPRSVWSPAGVLSMTQQARNHGVDGFVISWMGAAKNGEAYDVAATAAAQTNGVVAPYLEVAEALKGGVPVVEQWLREAVERTGPSSLMVDGEPVVFVWDMERVSPADWKAIIGRLDRPVRLVGDANTNTHGSVMDGWHIYLPPADLGDSGALGALRSGWFRGQAALGSTITPKLNVATVSPGFDDHLLRGDLHPVVSRSGGRYDLTWDSALAADPDMVLITSWNEWYEGTEIEPGTVFGTTALDTTAVRSAQWKTDGGGCTASVEAASSTASPTKTKGGRR